MIRANMDAAATEQVDATTDREQPARWRLICVSTTLPRWTTLAVQLADAKLPHPRIEWVDSAALLMECLRNDHYDAILVEHVSPRADSAIDTRKLLAGLRGGGHLHAVVVLISTPDDDLLAAIAQQECEALVSLSPWESPALLPLIQHAARQAELQRAYHGLQIKHQRRLQRDREEAEQLLRQQRQMLTALVESPEIPAAETTLVAIGAEYQVLLQAHLINQVEQPSQAISDLASALVQADISPAQVLSLHTDAVSRLVAGLGEQSSRHIVTRADRIGLDLMRQIADGYRRSKI